MSMPCGLQFGIKELPLDAIAMPGLRASLEHWQAARGDRPLPARGEVSPQSIRAALGYIGLVDVLREGGHPDGAVIDFRFRLFGTGMAEAQGADYTGCRVSSVQPAPYAALLRQSYMAVVTERAPKYHHIFFTHEDRRRFYFRLTMPLADDHAHPNLLWAVTHYHDEYWVGLEGLDRWNAAAIPAV